jgi:hypothetical protein
MNRQGIVENLREIFISIFCFLRSPPFEIINCKCKVSKVFISILFSLLFIIGFAQETHNLEIIWQKTSPDSVFYFGRCITSGDVNDDSFSDIMIVGDSVLDLSNPDSAYRGVCWVYLGGTNPDTIPDNRFNNLQKLIFWSLHSGDINGDGFDDVILGALNNAGGYGEVLIFLGGNPMDTICDYVLHSTQAGSCFGCAVATGDVNGDGYDDLIVGAYGAWPMPGGYDMGRVYIYYGGPNFDTIPDIILNGGHENDRESFGVSASGTGDVNDDGYKDIIIGAYNFGPNITGRIYIYYGGDPLDTIYDVAMTGEGTWHALGVYGVDFLKNIYAYDYAITGCCFWPNGFPRVSPGKVYVLFGGNPMDSVPDVWMIGRTNTSGLGDWTASAGDLNMSNSEEIVSGAPIEYNDKGSAYLWLGGTSLDTIPDAWLRGIVGGDGVGWMVASAGDVNGDGRDEVMVSNSAGRIPRVWVCKYTGSGIEEDRLPKTAFRIPMEIRPNPAKALTAIRFSLTAESRISLSIYDITGKLVKTIVNQDNMLKPGNYEARWDLRCNNQLKVSTGIYFLRFVADDGQAIIREINKITVIK